MRWKWRKWWHIVRRKPTRLKQKQKKAKESKLKSRRKSNWVNWNKQNKFLKCFHYWKHFVWCYCLLIIIIFIITAIYVFKDVFNCLNLRFVLRAFVLVDNAHIWTYALFVNEALLRTTRKNQHLQQNIFSGHLVMCKGLSLCSCLIFILRPMHLFETCLVFTACLFISQIIS